MVCLILDSRRKLDRRSKIPPCCNSGTLFMPDAKPDSLDHSSQRRMALSTWDHEGGVIPHRPRDVLNSGYPQADVPQLTNIELVQLRIRVIALENLVITLLAGASDRRLEHAREMATYISPRPGFTPHRLTVHAAAHMIDLIERAGQFRGS